MKKSSRNKWLLIAIAATALSGAAGNVMAGRANEITHFYYADDTHMGPMTGEIAYLCGSGTYQVGEPSPYVVTVTVPCVDGSPAAAANGALPTTFHNCRLREHDSFHGFICTG